MSRCSGKFGVVASAVLSLSMMLVLQGCANVAQVPTQQAELTSAWHPNTLRLPSSPRAACFSGQLGVEPWAENMAQSTVWLMAKGGLAGSGFIVRNSGGKPGSANRIVTAKHMIESVVLPSGKDEPFVPSGLVTVTASDGRLIGYAEVVAMAADTQQALKDGRKEKRGDVAVLQMLSFEHGAEAAYRAVPGMSIARVQPASTLQGLFSDPAGTEVGVSGSQVVDERDGSIVGVMVASDRMSSASKVGNWQSRVNMDVGGWGLDTKGHHTFGKRNVTLPFSSWGFAEPLTDRRVLAALGEAGMFVSLSRHREDAIPVQSAGYPLNGCVVYRGNMRPNSIVDLRGTK